MKLGLGLSLFAIVNCSNQKLSAGSGSSGGGPGGDDATGSLNQPCANDLKNITIPVKLLFIVDVSGSNLTQPQINYVGTDNGKVKRAGALQTFRDRYVSKTNFSYGFTYFSGNTSSALIGFDLNTPAFTTSADVFQQSINTFKTIPDSGYTPYGAALDLGIKAIQLDTARSAQTKWVVIFISDGIPTDANGYDLNTDAQTAPLITKVQTLVNQIPGQVTLSTIYYGRNDAFAANLMTKMAQAGGGKFLDANTSTGYNFQITDVVSIPGTNCQ